MLKKEELLITASLARLELDETEAEKLNQAASQMIEYFALMDKVDVENLSPTTHALVKENRTREDIPAEISLADKMIENAPEKEGRFIVVPNVL
ncbi:MAG: Asp-tRNA(Asn)/Glu-tRNA(Gln) amidotransferase subunit GatC [Spirochaetaceae bacterium]|nr:Asp-tRNA(Asn)/Glu-tRNA(Gln) amidotransferase subunit GatC [Spirochaetaceae bacterium]